mmetsp:Transcript_22259/g.69279  ORF Transcript_22259/g.69279 Transcript_22259/m.69279 type:complete len:344 (+) Transcript_22259:541-1572(+)
MSCGVRKMNCASACDIAYFMSVSRETLRLTLSMKTSNSSMARKGASVSLPSARVKARVVKDFSPPDMDLVSLTLVPPPPPPMRTWSFRVPFSWSTLRVPECPLRDRYELKVLEMDMAMLALVCLSKSRRRARPSWSSWWFMSTFSIFFRILFISRRESASSAVSWSMSPVCSTCLSSRLFFDSSRLPISDTVTSVKPPAAKELNPFDTCWNFSGSTSSGAQKSVACPISVFSLARFSSSSVCLSVRTFWTMTFFLFKLSTAVCAASTPWLASATSAWATSTLAKTSVVCCWHSSTSASSLSRRCVASCRLASAAGTSASAAASPASTSESSTLREFPALATAA